MVDAAGAQDLVRGLTLCTIARDGQFTLGVRVGAGVLDVRAAAAAKGVRAPLTVEAALRGEDLAGLGELAGAADRGDRSSVVPERDVAFGPCVTRPEKVIMMGMNYRKHCEETKIPAPAVPALFNKYANALLGHGGTLHLPSKVASQFDYESELVVVIGRRARDVAARDALSYVAGYCNGNDFSARDLQFKTSQFMAGKCSDGFAPLGPWLVGAARIPDPQRLRIECHVNGERRQSSSTSDMIFTCADLVSFCSGIMTLEPGDLIFTGTPEGVILGKPEGERVWLRAGDRVTTAIEGLGELSFTLA
jgi:2-keto-4-pentenoate hydratase/2-oxohepta-3-ene-1,7-dioic acid hydratase in catechol pathway